MSTDKATAAERLASTQVHGCELCAQSHGDQGLTPEELELDQLRGEVARLKGDARDLRDAAIRAAAKLIRLTQPEGVKDHPRYTLLDREQVVPIALELKREIDAIRARGGQ